MRNLLYLLVFCLVYSCQTETPKQLQTTSYRAVLKVNDSVDMPFVFDVLSANALVIKNAEERIEVDEIQYKNDSVFIKTPVFEGYIAAQLQDDGSLTGSFIKENFSDIDIYAADSNAKTPIEKLKHGKKFGIVFGSESHGLSDDLQDLVKDMMENDLKLMQKDQYLHDGGYETLNYYE